MVSKLILKPAFLPDKTPSPSSKMKCSLDSAVSNEELEILIKKNKGKIIGEIFTGLTVLNPSLVRRVRRGIEIKNKKHFFTARSSSISSVFETLSKKYALSKYLTLPELKIADENIWNNYLLKSKGARIHIYPSATYNHYGIQSGLNEIWIGGDIESFGSSYTGSISPNLNEFFRTGSVFLRGLSA